MLYRGMQSNHVYNIKVVFYLCSIGSIFVVHDS